MAGKIGRWGNSAAVRIPRDVLERAGLREGQAVEIVVVNGREVAIRPAVKAPRYTLEELVAEMERIPPEDRPPLVDWGPPVGAEILPEDEYSRGEITLEDILSGRARSERG